jgi:hypothetical protein
MVQVEERSAHGTRGPGRGRRYRRRAAAPGAVQWWRHLPPPGAAALAGWSGLVVVAHLWGRQLIDAGHRLQLGPGHGAAPIVGAIDLRLGVRVLPGLALAAAGVAWGPSLAARLGWRRLLAVAALGAAAFAVALAVIDPGGLTRPLLGRGEYLHDVGRVGSPFVFLDHFADRLATYHTHTQGHPPGMLLVLWTLDRIGLGGAGWAAALVIAGGAAAVPATMVAVRALVGEATARAAAPFLVLAPAAIWVASTADALYLGVIAIGIALLALAGAADGANCAPGTTPEVVGGAQNHVPGSHSDAQAAGAGLLLGAACFLTYGAVLAAPLAAAVAIAQRRWRPFLIAAASALTVAAAFAAAGFWWPDGLAATRHAYFAGVATRRPYGYFLVANLAAFALVVGPAAAVALTRIRPGHFGDTPTPGGSVDRPAAEGLWLMVGGALLAVVLADLSGLSKGEVERIWLPFAPWVLAATATLGRSRPWLGLQTGATLALAVSVRTPW